MKMMKKPHNSKNHSGGLILTFRPFMWTEKINIANMIIVTAHMIGAITGPAQTIGIRKRTSHVRREDGQFNNSFNQK
jgi:hypothetical protein